jgi:hypothetical protein
VGAENKIPFWEALWLEGKKPDDIALLILGIKTKKWIIKIPMDNNAWIEKIKMNEFCPLIMPLNTWTFGCYLLTFNFKSGWKMIFNGSSPQMDNTWQHQLTKRNFLEPHVLI